MLGSLPLNYPEVCALTLSTPSTHRVLRTPAITRNIPLPVSGYYGHSGYLDSQRMTSLVDQHVSVISSVSSLRPFPAVYADVHDPLNILDEPGRKTTGAYFTESEPGTGEQRTGVPKVTGRTLKPSHVCQPSAGSAPCMFGVSSPFPSQDALLAQRGPSSSEVQDLVSSLPPINTVFMGAGGVQ